MFLRLRLRNIGPYACFAAGGVVVSYSAAMLMDASRKKRDAPSFLLRRRFNEDQGTGLLRKAKRLWCESRESQRTIYSLVALNAVIFLAWSLKPTSRYLSKYFLHSINSHPLSMLGSTFSHKSLLHLAFNMVALNSFGVFLHERMGREQFLAFYLSSGLGSSFASHVYKSLRFNHTPSLGASGAIFGVFGACAHYPELKVSLIFLPMQSIPINYALPVISAFDAFGMMRNWSVFDHAAHLGGALFGYALYPISQEQVWKNRRRILKSFGMYK